MTDVINLLKRHGIRANKSLGQNFLHKTDIIENIAKNAAGTDCALEIGADPGVLSKCLCGSFKKGCNNRNRQHTNACNARGARRL